MESRKPVAGLPRHETCRRMLEMIDTRYVTGYKEICFGAFAIAA